MKKCPTCSKTFDDKMRFCQTDGTPLVEVKEDAPPPDPYATMVGGKEDLASLIPDEEVSSPADSPKQAEKGLDSPEDEDPLKTSVVSEAEMRELRIDEAPIKPPDSSPFEKDSSSSSESRSSQKSDSLPMQPEPPKFNEPTIKPPSFGDEQPSEPSKGFQGSEPISQPKSEPPSFGKPPSPGEFMPKESSREPVSGSPIPSPFEEKMPPPSKPFKEPEPPKAEPSTPFGTPSSPFSESSFGDSEPKQPVRQPDWQTPQPSQMNFGDQPSSGSPPTAGQGQNKTLAIVSLILGVVSIPCCGFVLFGIAAVITGFMAKSKADNSPSQYGGRGLALAGIALGAITTLIGIITNLLALLGFIPIPNLG